MKVVGVEDLAEDSSQREDSMHMDAIGREERLYCKDFTLKHYLCIKTDKESVFESKQGVCV